MSGTLSQSYGERVISTDTEVAIVGAGPYGLSVAAHLRSSDVRFRIFGTPMHTWCAQMPDGMLLKSDGFASNLSDPDGRFTLKRFCEMTDTPYDDTTIPIDLETFRAYGLAFQKRLVPELEDTQVTRIEQADGAYRLRLENGRTVSATTVVLAVGISHSQYLPPVLSGLSSEYVTHSAAHKDLARFAGRSVAIVGGGASAIDMAVLLHEAGAAVTLVARQPVLRFADPPSPHGRSWWDGLRHPSSPIGPGWRSRIYSDAPWLFRLLPHAWRTRIVRQHSAPRAGWPMKARFVGHVPALLGYTVEKAEVDNGRVRLSLVGAAGRTPHTADHVIAATGYKPDVRRLGFLSEDIRRRVRVKDHVPVLSSDFESSVSGLYFVGSAAADSFGPVMKFACGAPWTARRLSASLPQSVNRGGVPAPAPTPLVRHSFQ
jgi:thioredoxin reductase